jgi:C4-type Zn-finger protein
MPSVQSNDLAPPIRAPECPVCNKPMRLKRASPDIRFTNLTHFVFECECGRDSDQLVMNENNV